MFCFGNGEMAAGLFERLFPKADLIFHQFGERLRQLRFSVKIISPALKVVIQGYFRRMQHHALLTRCRGDLTVESKVTMSSIANDWVPMIMTLDTQLMRTACNWHQFNQRNREIPTGLADYLIMRPDKTL